MEKIELYTKLLEYVATVELPAMLPAPDVVLWGVRYFRALGHPVYTGNEIGQRGKPTAYVECFVYASMTESPGLERWEPPTPPPVNRDARDVVGKAVAQGEPDKTTDESGQHAGYVVLTAEERAKGFVRPVRNSYMHLKCKYITSMGREIAETYARDPGFYGSTYCSKCKGHFPVGANGEFEWLGETTKVGT